MYAIIYNIHKFSVIIFITLYVVKTFLLLTNKDEMLAHILKFTKIPEMVVSLLFLASGLYMLFQYPMMGAIYYIKIMAVFASIPLAIVGFRKKNKYLASASLLLLFGAYGMAEINKNSLNRNFKVLATDNSGSNKPDVLIGKKVYTQGCVMCHGDEGNAGIAGSADLTLSTKTDDEIAMLLKYGKNSMPKFSNLNEAQVSAVTAYIKTLRK